MLLSTHVSVEVAAFAWATVSRAARERFGPSFLDAVTARVSPPDPERFRGELGRLVAEALAELDRGDRMFGPVPDTEPPEEPRAVVRRSRTLSEARAQVACLQTRLMDLQARIVPLRALGEPS